MWIRGIQGATPGEDMPGLNDNDLKRIDARINAAYALLVDQITAEGVRLRPRGWKKALYLLREWGVLGVTATIIIALLGIVVALVIAVSNRREADAIFRANANNFQERTGERLTRIEASLLGLRAKAVASNPADSENQAEAKSVLAAAKKESIRLPVPVIELGGNKFIEAAKTDPKAWDVALEFVAYRSFLNAQSRPRVPTEPMPTGTITNYEILGAPGKPPPEVSWSKPIVGEGQVAARWDRLGQDRNQDKHDQPTWLYATGGATSVDTEQIRNVVLIGVEVHYSGAPVILENVIFINCVFVFDNNDGARKLGRMLLASATINFRAPA